MLHEKFARLRIIPESTERPLRGAACGWFWFCIPYIKHIRYSIQFESARKANRASTVLFVSSCYRAPRANAHYLVFISFYNMDMVCVFHQFVMHFFFSILLRHICKGIYYTKTDEFNEPLFLCIHAHTQTQRLTYTRITILEIDLVPSCTHNQIIHRRKKPEPMVPKEKLIHIAQNLQLCRRLYKANYVSLRLSRSLSLSATRCDQFTLRFPYTHRLCLTVCFCSSACPLAVAH